MKILYVDTTTPDLVVAVVEENSITNVTAPSVGVHHSEMLCEKVAEALKLAKIDFSDLSAYACAIGPGSFTGIRIGISTVKGYRSAVSLPYVSVCCLEAIARSKNCGAKGCAVIDAGNGFYFADYDEGVSPMLVPYDDERAQNAGRASSATDYFDGAVSLIKEKFALGKFENELTPLYVRRSQAEENKK